MIVTMANIYRMPRSKKRIGTHNDIIRGYRLLCFHQRIHQFIDADWLADVILHAGGEAHFAVAFHGVGGHGNDVWLRDVGPDLRILRVASSPSISGICTSIRYHIICLPFNGFYCLHAVRRNICAVSHLLKDARREFLIDLLILCQQNAQGMSSAKFHIHNSFAGFSFRGDKVSLRRYQPERRKDARV